MRMLVECTYVYEHPEDNSGIQRVVRNIINNLPRINSKAHCIPVMMSGGQLYEVLSLAPLKPQAQSNWKKNAIIRLDQLRNRYWFYHARIERRAIFQRFPLLKRLLYWPCKVMSLSITLPLRVLLYLNRNEQPAPQRARLLEAQPGDQLVLLDSSWHANFFTLAEQLKQQGVGIISVVYDLIPLTHPQFCDAGLVKVFDQWFNWIARTADGFMAISQTVSQQVAKEIHTRLGSDAAQKRWHNYFHLGSELDLQHAKAPLHSDLLRMFEQPGSVYLMVSTIEPRKNHAYLLDSFEQLWAAGLNVRLCIIGKIGWKCEDLVERIQQHPQWGKRLFMFNNINDSSLEYAYQHAQALVFPSHAEGFGLPLVEAMQRGLPVLASDLPVFREIGQNFMAYFNLQQPESLAHLIKTYEARGNFPADQTLEHWQWINWQQAAEQLVNRIHQQLESTSTQAQPRNAHCS